MAQGRKWVNIFLHSIVVWLQCTSRTNSQKSFLFDNGNSITQNEARYVEVESIVKREFGVESKDLGSFDAFDDIDFLLEESVSAERSKRAAKNQDAKNLYKESQKVSKNRRRPKSNSKLMEDAEKDLNMDAGLPMDGITFVKSITTLFNKTMKTLANAAMAAQYQDKLSKQKGQDDRKNSKKKISNTNNGNESKTFETENSTESTANKHPGRETSSENVHEPTSNTLIEIDDSGASEKTVQDNNTPEEKSSNEYMLLNIETSTNMHNPQPVDPAVKQSGGDNNNMRTENDETNMEGEEETTTSNSELVSETTTKIDDSATDDDQISTPSDTALHSDDPSEQNDDEEIPETTTSVTAPPAPERGPPEISQAAQKYIAEEMMQIRESLSQNIMVAGVSNTNDGLSSRDGEDSNGRQVLNNFSNGDVFIFADGVLLKSSGLNEPPPSRVSSGNAHEKKNATIVHKPVEIPPETLMANLINAKTKDNTNNAPSNKTKAGVNDNEGNENSAQYMSYKDPLKIWERNITLTKTKLQTFVGAP